MLCNCIVCGRPADTVSMRIVGGRRAEPHAYPWTVAILKNDRMHCGGAIVTNKHVLSAGHCFKWDNFTTMEALLGLDNFDDLRNVAKRTFIDVTIHEKFTSTAVRDENDIAIATLDKPVVFSETIVPVCLPQRGQDFTGLIGTIVGWGRMGTEMSSSRALLKASLRLLSYEECLNSKLKDHLKPTMMCAFSKGKDGCQGDSGGPLLVFEPSGKYVQAVAPLSRPFTATLASFMANPKLPKPKSIAQFQDGVVSWGIGCADPKYPGVYTKVCDYIDWILKHTAGGERCDD